MLTPADANKKEMLPKIPKTFSVLCCLTLYVMSSLDYYVLSAYTELNEITF